jgi:hypothetical protein
MAVTKQRISLKDVSLSISGRLIGGAEEVSVTISAEDSVAYEGASYFPAEIVDGQIGISGSVTRAFIDVELLNALFPPETGVKPYFDIIGEVISGKTPGRTMHIMGAKFNSIDINGLGLTDYAKNALAFNAVNWKFS